MNDGSRIGCNAYAMACPARPSCRRGRPCRRSAPSLYNRCPRCRPTRSCNCGLQIVRCCARHPKAPMNREKSCEDPLLDGLTIARERVKWMMESWPPLDVTGIISALNFPLAVWACNAAPALNCGSRIVWKPLEKTPWTALVTQALLERALKRPRRRAPEALSALLLW